MAGRTKIDLHFIRLKAAKTDWLSGYDLMFALLLSQSLPQLCEVLYGSIHFGTGETKAQVGRPKVALTGTNCTVLHLRKARGTTMVPFVFQKTRPRIDPSVNLV